MRSTCPLVCSRSARTYVKLHHHHTGARALQGQWNVNVEGLHGLGAYCLTANTTSGTRCPTIFAAPPTLAASFNMTLLRAVGDAVATEARAYNNYGGIREYLSRPIDLVFWLPNVNIGRDPRWGRQVETYSEDPWLTGQLGASMVDGAQSGFDGGASGGGYRKMVVAVKHATAYQVENDRMSRDQNITQHDLVDTYYQAWQAVIEDGGAAGVMCACEWRVGGGQDEARVATRGSLAPLPTIHCRVIIPPTLACTPPVSRPPPTRRPVQQRRAVLCGRVPADDAVQGDVRHGQTVAGRLVRAGRLRRNRTYLG